MEQLVDLIVKVIAALLGIGILYVVGKLRAYLAAKASAADATKLDAVIYDFVAAAEQLLKADDPTGEKRKAYVVDLLRQIGVEVTREIDARIEAAVYGINIGGGDAK